MPNKKIYGYHFLEEMITDDMVAEFREHMPDFYIPPELSNRNDRITMV